MKYFIKTFGCQQNAADSERVAQACQSRGMEPARSLDDADYIVINTCMVRETAENRVYGLVNNLKERKAIGTAKENVRRTLLSLYRKNRYDKLTEQEYKFYKLLEEVPGDRKKVFRHALKNFRVQKGQKNFFMKGLIEGNKYIN